MPHLAERATHIPASPIRKLANYSDQAKKRGLNVFHLNIGQPDLPTPKVFFEAIIQSLPHTVAYTHSAGNYSLREAIRNYYEKYNCILTIEDIIVTTGASEALNFLAAAIINPGDEVIIPEPFYANYISLFISAGAKVVPIPTFIYEGFRLPEPEAFERLITHKTKAILLCNPGNPTGALYPESSIRKLEEIALKYDLFLVADEVYREFVYDGMSHFSVLELARAKQHIILVDSISKRFSACGARIGCIVSRNQELMEVMMKLAQIRLSPPTLEQAGAEALYGLPSSYYEEVVNEYVKRRDLVVQRLNTIEGCFCPPVQGAFYVMAQLPVEDAEDFCRWLLTDFSYQGNTVMMAPGSGFYDAHYSGKDQVRIAYVLNMDDLRRAMDCLEMALHAYPGKKLKQTRTQFQKER